MKLRLAFAVLLGTTTVVLSASAQQPWIQDRRLGEGAGIRTGNLELHPSIAGEFGYDSNYFQRGPGDPDPVVDTLRLRITPSLTLSTLGRVRADQNTEATPPLLNFDLGAFATYNEFIPLDDTDDFDNRGKLSGGVNASLELFPKRPIMWDLNAGYRRQIDPSDLATGDTDFDRHVLRAGTGVTWTPGGGLFEWRVGYGVTATYFTEEGFDLLNNAQHVFETRGRWRFLPRTAAIYDGSFRMIRYSEDSQDQVNGEVIQSRVGLSGLLTNRFAFRVLGGWAASFYNTDENFDGPVGNAEVKFFLTPNPRVHASSAPVGLSSIAVGYDRAFAHSYLGPFYQRDQGYLTFEYFIGGVVVTSLRGHISRNAYPTFDVAADADGDPTTPGTNARSIDVHETRLGGTLFAEYRLTSFFGINATFDVDRNIGGGDNPIPVEPPDDLDFTRYQAYLGARVFW
ncbi:MAG TPA: hypothetical protein VFU02_05050 [Polyangiaceae bacterium]|nr:hypothetical protein [Polyangiaceae bacterium]